MVDARSIPVVNTHLVLLQLHCQQSPVEYCQLTRPFLSVKGLAGKTMRGSRWPKSSSGERLLCLLTSQTSGSTSCVFYAVQVPLSRACAFLLASLATPSVHYWYSRGVRATWPNVWARPDANNEHQRPKLPEYTDERLVYPLVPVI